MIVVLLSGRPLTINWIDRNASAIVEAWFQGEFCGSAIADVLFGDYNPSAKLPITFPKTVGQIPYNFPFKRGSQVRTEDLNAQEKKTLVNGALYPFGYGLTTRATGTPTSRSRRRRRRRRGPCRSRLTSRTPAAAQATRSCSCIYPLG